VSVDGGHFEHIMVVALNKGKKGKDVDLYSAFHAPGTPNAHTSLKLTRQTAI